MQIVFDSVTRVTQQMLNQLLTDTAKFVNELPDHTVRHLKELPEAVMKFGPRIRNGDVFLCLLPKVHGKKQDVRIQWYIESPKNVDMGPAGDLSLAPLNVAWEAMLAPRPRDLLQLAFQNLQTNTNDNLDIKEVVKGFMDRSVGVVEPSSLQVQLKSSSGRTGEINARNNPFSPERPRIEVTGDLTSEQFQLFDPGSKGLPVERVLPTMRREQVFRRPVFVSGDSEVSAATNVFRGRVASFGYQMRSSHLSQWVKFPVELPRFNFLWEVFRSESEAMKTTTSEQ